MTEPFLTISAFARTVDLAPSTLRYYHECGLLPPAEVDVQTGYRYYTPALERRAHLIRRMREVGIPIETMRLVLDSSPDQADELLQRFAAEAAEFARRTAAAVTDVVASLRAEEVAASPLVVQVDGPELAAALRRVSCAASTEPDSPLGVVLLDVQDSQLTVVATDRYWLAMWSTPLRDVNLGEYRVVLPIGEVGDLLTWLSREDVVTLSAAGNRICLRGEEREFTVSAVDDRFPAYRLLIQGQQPACGRATVGRDALLSAIRDDAPQSTTSSDASTVRLAVGRDRVTVSEPEGCEGVHLDATTSGDPITLGFSSRLLRSALTAVVGAEATLAYASPELAVRVTTPEQRCFTALAMPSRLDG